jgi:hypothetical protein
VGGARPPPTPPHKLALLCTLHLKRGKEQGGPVVKRAIKDPLLSLPASVCRREKVGWGHRIKNFK